MIQTPFTQFRKHEKVEEVHHPEHKQHDTQLGTERFQNALQVPWCSLLPERECHVTDIDEIEAPPPTGG